MKKSILVTTRLIASAAILIPVLYSCVNKEYDIQNLDTEITLASEGIELPLGKTAPITIQDLLKGMDQDMITALENGTYAFRISESLALSENLPDMDDLIKVPDVAFQNSININISDFNADDFKLSGQKFETGYGLEGTDFNFDIKVPQINENSSQNLGLSDYGKKADDVSVDLADTDFLVGVSMGGFLPAVSIPSGEFPITISNAIAIEPTVKTVAIQMDPVEGISNISDIQLTSDSNLTIEAVVTNSFLTKGSFIPDITIDLDNLMNIKGSGAKIKLDSDFALSASNGFKARKQFQVESINLESGNWTSSGFSQTNTMQVSGTVSLSDAYTTSENINAFGGTLQLNITVKYDEIQIASFKMDIDEIPVEEEQTIPLTIDSISLPEEVESLDEVVFTEASRVNISMLLSNLQNIPGLAVNLESLQITFPEELEVEGAVNGVITRSDKDLIAGYNDAIYIKSMKLSRQPDGSISLDKEIKVKASAKASGTGILSTNIPRTKDGQLTTTLKSSIEIKDYAVTVASMTKAIEEVKYPFSYEVDKSVAEYGTVTIYPSGNPSITIQIVKPDIALDVKASTDEGISITFPDFLHFTDVPNLDQQSNTYTIKGTTPSSITLPVEKLTVTPETENNENYFVKGDVLVSGTVVTDSKQLHKKEVEALGNAEFKLNTIIPDMTPQDIALEEFRQPIDRNFEVTIFKAGQLPKELVSLTEAQLKDVFTNLKFTVNNLPDLNTDINVDAEISFPKMIVIDANDPRVSENKLKISGTIENGKLAVEPVKIDKIDLAGCDLTKDLTGNIVIAGDVYALNPKADIADLAGNIDIDIDVKIPDIKFGKVVGKIDYDIENINQSIKIEGLPDFMKDENFSLDFANPHLLLKVKTNLGIPISADLDLTPVFNNADGTPVSCQIALPASSSASETLTTSFWLANTDNGCPSDCRHIEADIRGLLKKIPDEFKLVLDAKTGTETDGVIEPDSDYTLDVDYEFVAPFEFGTKTNIETEQIVEGLTADIGNLLKKNSLKIGGEITNTLPLQLLLSIELLDSDKNVIPMDSPVEQVIKACASDGSASVTQVDLTLHKNDKEAISSLAALKLKYKVTSPVAGVSINKDSFLQAALTIALPEGFTLDFKDSDKKE